MNGLTAQFIVNIIKQEMELDDNAVWLRDQNRLIPNDRGLYIVVGMINSKPICNTVYMAAETVDNVVQQHQINEVQQREEIQIDVFSRSNEAIARNWEIIAAIQSIYAQQQQELNNFKIFRNQLNFVNTSIAEGGSMLNRYSLVLATMVWYRKDKLLDSPLGDYYDDFTTRVDDAQTIGTANPIAEFEITPDSPPPP